MVVIVTPLCENSRKVLGSAVPADACKGGCGPHVEESRSRLVQEHAVDDFSEGNAVARRVGNTWQHAAAADGQAQPQRPQHRGAAATRPQRDLHLRDPPSDPPQGVSALSSVHISWQ